MKKLYVWDEYCPVGFDNGIAFAIADSEDEARVAVSNGAGISPWEWGSVKVYPVTDTVAFSRVGND